MAQSKNSSWVVPSFDNVPTKRTPLKRNNSELSEPNLTDVTNTFTIFKKRSHMNSLSALLAACEPQKATELAISRQKQQDILNWLQYKASRSQSSVLILSGPSGCGKTVAIKLLAKENGYSVMEWINPVDQILDENNRVMRQGDKFEEFLVRATRYNSLFSEYSRKLLVVKDFPNVYLEDKESFFALLEKYFQLGREPIVFICTETGNSRVLQTLFPPNIKEKFGIDSISINSVTQAAMKNLLKRIASILNANAGHMLHVSQQKMDEILSNNIGDIRSSLLNLIFISLKVPELKTRNDCGSREETLGLLHGIGRVINPKRIQEGDRWKFVHDPDEIAAFFQSHATVFLNFLQENYLNTMRGIEEVQISSDILSLGDVLNSEWRDPNLGKITLSFCIRGVMVTNEKPVSGWNPVRKPQNDQLVVRRVLSDAEVRWYESIIKPKVNTTMEQQKMDSGEIIE